MLSFFLEIHMENQMNVGNQNTQQIGQNPVNQPVISPEKPRTNYFLIGGLVLASFVVFGFGGYYLGKQSVVLPPSPSISNNSQIDIPTSTPKPTQNPLSTWKTYTDPNKVYEFKYPPNYSLGHYAGDNSPLLLNNRIDWGITQHAAGGCMGDCPVITNKSESLINGYKATIYKGWVGSIGGETPQSYIKYEIQEPGTGGIEGPNYFVATLWELDRTSAVQKNYSQTRDVGDISSEDAKIFEQIISTLKFLN